MKAVVTIMASKDGVYGMHDQTGWDDLPYWKFWDAWIVKVEATGLLPWGPFKYRKDAKREHHGIAKVEICEKIIFKQEQEAESHALKIAEKLEYKEFDVELAFCKDSSSQNLDTKINWLDNGPPQVFKKRIKASVTDLR